MKADFKIRPVKNGLLLECVRYDDESEELVYQETEVNEIEAFAQFLRLLADEYGPSTSRYSEKRIRVKISPGDKFDGPDLEAQKALKEWLGWGDKAPTIEDAFLAGWHLSDFR